LMSRETDLMRLGLPRMNLSQKDVRLTKLRCYTFDVYIIRFNRREHIISTDEWFKRIFSQIAYSVSHLCLDTYFLEFKLCPHLMTGLNHCDVITLLPYMVYCACTLLIRSTKSRNTVPVSTSYSSALPSFNH